MNGPRCDCDLQSTVPCKPFIGSQHCRYRYDRRTLASAVLSARESSITITLHNDLVAASNPDTSFAYYNQQFSVRLVSTREYRINPLYKSQHSNIYAGDKTGHSPNYAQNRLVHYAKIVESDTVANQS